MLPMASGINIVGSTGVSVIGGAIVGGGVVSGAVVGDVGTTGRVATMGSVVPEVGALVVA